MQFRWVALIALWTCLIGPIVGAPSGPPGSAGKSATVKNDPPPSGRTPMRR